MDGYKLTSADILGLVIFLSALLVRAILQAMAGPNEMPDLGWITTFAGMAAIWLSLGSRTRDVHNQLSETKDLAEKTEHNTNGELTRKLEELEARVMAAINGRSEETKGQKLEE